MSTTTRRVAVTQHEPVWFDLAGTVEKTCKLIKEAAAGGADLIAFPELWVPGYPTWIWSRPVDFDLGVRYVQNSLAVDSPEMSRIRLAAATSKISVVLGFSERDGESVYIAQAIIDASGTVQMTRRKMKPTHMERTIFGDASGSCLDNVVELPVAKVGALACWEHMQPLLKYSTLAQQEQIHVAGWPVLDSFFDGSPGLWSMSDTGCLGLSQAYAAESQTFVLHCTTALSEESTKAMGTTGSPIMGREVPGSSAVIGPDGRVLVSGKGKEELLFADLDFTAITKVKTFADARGHYSRPDMLWLGVDSEVKSVVRGLKPRVVPTTVEKEQATTAGEE